MTRSKKTPSLNKPPFDEESALRFAKMEPKAPAGKQGEATGKGTQPERLPITLLLKADTITALQKEAQRKGKAVDQIIDKLVAKQLGKH
jgi:hypothetical protein